MLSASTEGSSANTDRRHAQLLENAVRFLQDPQVRASGVARQVEFLQGKGLSRSEIEEAMRQTGMNPASQVQSVSAAQPPPLPVLPPPSSDNACFTVLQPRPVTFDWGRFALVIALVGSAGVALAQSFIFVGTVLSGGIKLTLVEKHISSYSAY